MSFYYLHSETKDLIWKKFEPEQDSPFVLKVWPCDISDRKDAWTIVLESLALGASHRRVKELCFHWNCDIEDFEHMLTIIGKPTLLMQKGATIFLEDILSLNADQYWGQLAKRKS